MRRVIILLAILFVIGGTSRAQQRLLSFELVESYTQHEMDSIIALLANGANLLFTAEYDVDFYKVSYLTPYRHPDSLVKATGAVMIPRGTTCPMAMLGYGHGTMSDRGGAPSLNPGQGETLLGMIYATRGLMVGMPDYLGLGESDSSILIHPYITGFHQGHSMVNMLRTAREMADSLGENLNGQLFLSGYSQGGYTTMATHKLIEEQYSNEFTITASAPMSGPYDLKVAQVELMASDSAYATPGYLPYIILAYQSYYGDLYDSIQQILKPPYDSIMPAAFFGGQVGIGTINGMSTPVPKDMIHDSVVQAFESDSLHPLRLALADNHLLDWAPQAPVKLHYCNQDDQVSFLNSEVAFDAWTNNGALNVEKEDFGPFDHGGCVFPAMLNSGTYIQSFVDNCATGIPEPVIAKGLKVFPNPAIDEVMIQVPEVALSSANTLTIYDIAGRQAMSHSVNTQWVHINLSGLSPGMYVVTVQSEGLSYRSKLMVK